MTTQQTIARIAAELRTAGQLPPPAPGEDRHGRARKARARRAENAIRYQLRRAAWLAGRR